MPCFDGHRLQDRGIYACSALSERSTLFVFGFSESPCCCNFFSILVASIIINVCGCKIEVKLSSSVIMVSGYVFHYFGADASCKHSTFPKTSFEENLIQIYVRNVRNNIRAVAEAMCMRFIVIVMTDKMTSNLMLRNIKIN